MKIEFTDEEREMLKELLKSEAFTHDINDNFLEPEKCCPRSWDNSICTCCDYLEECAIAEKELKEQYLNELELMFLEEDVVHKVKFKGNIKKMLDDMTKKFKSRDIARSILEEYLHFNYTDIIGIGYNKELDTTTIQYYEF